MNKSIISLIMVLGSFGYIIITGSLMIIFDFPLKDQIMFCYTPGIVLVLLAIILHVFNMTKQPKLTEVKHD